jgi:hypothetical protein
MADRMRARIAAGGRVICTDGALGAVGRAPGADADVTLVVMVPGRAAPLLVPIDRVRSVDGDGTVRLDCTRAAALAGSGDEATLELREERLVVGTTRGPGPSG